MMEAAVAAHTAASAITGARIRQVLKDDKLGKCKKGSRFQSVNGTNTVLVYS
jgi:hypothetical protein